MYKNICFEIINSLLKIYIVGRLLFSCRINLCKSKIIRATFSCNLPHKKCCVASCDCLLTVLPPSHATSFMLQKVEATPTFCKSIFVARGGGNTVNNGNLQYDICCANSCKKMLPVSLDLQFCKLRFLLLVRNSFKLFVCFVFFAFVITSE